MVDKDTIMQVICGLMINPQYLSENDKYILTVEDFSSLFEKYVFSAIYNLYKDGAEKIAVVDIDNYFNLHQVAKTVFEKANGVEYLQDCLEFCNADNFPFYYKRLKKLNALEDLKKMGYPINEFYEEDLTNDKAKNINDNFEKLEITDIFQKIKKDIMAVETKYEKGNAAEAVSANEGIGELIKSLKVKPEVGARLQGDIFNTVCRGARKTKFYIRTMASGVGKTRAAIGDACLLSYPLRFNQSTWEWEWNGANEKTLFIATEQEIEEIQTLVLAYLTGINEENILFSTYTSAEEEVVKQAEMVMNYFSDNLFIVRLSDPNIEQIKAVVRKNWLEHDIQNVFYDYIFSSPSLLTEFRDLKVREDVALGMMSAALKDLAVEMKLFVMSSTQTNGKVEDEKGIKNESVVRGARSIIDKGDIACIVSRVTPDEEELLSEVIENTGIIPNQVMDVYKVRRGRYTNVKIWSCVDLGTCRKLDLFITDVKYKEIEGFRTIDFLFEEDNEDILKLLKQLNNNEKIISETEEVEEINPIQQVDNLVKEKKGLFGDLI